jgi:hypothetical protein
MFHEESEYGQRLRRIEKMLENMPDKIDQNVDVLLDVYRHTIVEEIGRLMVPLRESLEVLLYRTSANEKIERDIQSLAHDTDVYIDEVREIVTSHSEMLADIKATLHEMLEQMNDS